MTEQWLSLARLCFLIFLMITGKAADTDSICWFNWEDQPSTTPRCLFIGSALTSHIDRCSSKRKTLWRIYSWRLRSQFHCSCNTQTNLLSSSSSYEEWLLHISPCLIDLSLFHLTLTASFCIRNEYYDFLGCKVHPTFWFDPSWERYFRFQTEGRILCWTAYVNGAFWNYSYTTDNDEKLYNLAVS